MNWRDALLAMTEDACTRRDNSKLTKNGPSGDHDRGLKEGAAYAFDVMAREMDYLAKHATPKEALKRLRELLARRRVKP